MLFRSEKEMDDGVEKYEIEFVHEKNQYDYEINAADGTILSYDADIEGYLDPEELKIYMICQDISQKRDSQWQ